MLSKNESMLVETLENREVREQTERVNISAGGCVTLVPFQDGEPVEVIQCDVPNVDVRVRGNHYDERRGDIGVESGTVVDVEDVKVNPHYDSDKPVVVYVQGRLVPFEAKYIQTNSGVHEV